MAKQTDRSLVDDTMKEAVIALRISTGKRRARSTRVCFNISRLPFLLSAIRVNTECKCHLGCLHLEGDGVFQPR